MEYMLRKNTFAEKGLYGKTFFCLVGKRGGDGERGEKHWQMSCRTAIENKNGKFFLEHLLVCVGQISLGKKSTL